MRYQFDVYNSEAAAVETRYLDYKSESSAKSAAGRMSKVSEGPVDLARDDGSEWNERYITTASPSEYHTSGFRFERLDG